MRFSFLEICVSVLGPAVSILGLNLSLIDTRSRLPGPTIQLRALYDNQDSIYLVGGHVTTAYQSDVLKYSLQSGAVEVVGRFTSVGNGAAILNGDRIVTFGGYPIGSPEMSTVYEYSLDTRNYRRVNDLPRPNSGMASVWDSTNEVAYLFGGEYNYLADKVLRYNATNHEISEVAQLPGERGSATAVWDPYNQVAFIFKGGVKSLVYDPESGVTELPTLPGMTSCMCAVFVSASEVYLMTETRVVKFNPSSYESEQIIVTGYPPALYCSGCAYVPKEARIYIFGGRTAGTYTNIIWYIDLQIDPPPTPTTTTSTTSTSTTPTTTEQPPHEDCSDGVTKTIADPFCCESFYFCHAGVPTKFYCPENQQFNPSIFQCEDPSIVRCGITYGRDDV